MIRGWKRFTAAGIAASVILGGMSGCSLKTAGGYYSDALSYYEDKNYTLAAQNFELAIERNPERAEFYIDYGLMKIETGDYEDALATFDKAILNKDIKMVQENNKRAYRGRGIAYFYMLKYERALEEFNLALEIDELSSLNLDILSYKGSVCEKLGLWKEAVSAYDEILRNADGNADIYTARAYAYLNIGGIQMSRDDYDRALALEPDNINIYLGKYALMKLQNDEIGAAAVLSQAERLPVETAEDRLLYAKIQYYQKDESAKELLLDAAEEGSTLAYFYLGEIVREEGDYEQALTYYNAYLESGNIESSALYNQMAVCSMETGDYNRALSYIQQGLLVSTPEQAKTLRHNEVAVYEKQGDFAAAYEKAGEFLEDYPEDERMLREYEFLSTRINDEGA